MKRSFIVCLLSFFLLVSQFALAEIKLPAIVSSNMVLQRDTEIVIWGWADAKEKITITASWINEPIDVKADKAGNWRVTVKTTTSKDPQTITLTSKSSDIRLENKLFGEVWLCSGQSNMQQPMTGYADQPTFREPFEIASSANPNLRLFTVERKGSKTPLQDLDDFKSWQEATPENVASFSAVAYFFGKQLQQILDIPVGMIHTSWGGSKVQAWISKEMFTEYEEVNLEDVDITQRTNHIPTALYNAMIHPLIPYTIKGALWYQGESNRGEPGKYEVFFPAMVKDWRSRWGIGDFPFYYVQIAPYWYNDYDAFSTTKNSAYIREAQLTCVDLIPNSGIAITMDIGEEYYIHPAKKKEVADRLLLNALHQDYGFETVDCYSPVYDSLNVVNGTVELFFKNAEKGLYSNGELTGFEIAGEDKVFYPAEANVQLYRRKLIVKSEQVPNPVAVRYGWMNWIEGTLYDTNLLPASSFRTDSWNDATRSQ